MLRYRTSPIRFSLPALMVLACGGEPSNPTPPPPPPSSVPASIAISAGDQQQAAPGQSVSIAPAVVVRDAEQRPVSGAVVSFAVTSGGGTVQDASPVTDASGIARLGRWTLGPTGDQRLSATVASLAPVTFRATVTGGTGGGGTLQTTIGAGGGGFEISTAGHPYQGLRITVPSGTFAGTQQMSFAVVQQPALPTLPTGFRISGPVLAVTSSQERGAELMTLRVPISNTAGEQVVLAFHDPVRRVTEILPAVYRDASQIVVLTSHLRADLLAGPGLPAGANMAASQSRNDPVGWLMPVSYPVPMPQVGSVMNDGSRWPVLDYGSAQRPAGFGAAIPVLQSIGAAMGRSFAQFEPALSTPGFYGDGAQMAAVTRVAQATAGAAQTLGKYVNQAAQVAQQAGGQFDKEQRDELDNQLIVAALAINRKPFPVALTRDGSPASEPVFTTAVSGANNVVGVLAPAMQSIASLTRQSAGFVQLALQRVGGGAQVQVDRAIPMTSFLVDFKVAAQSVEKAVQISSMAVGSATRTVATRAMMVEAGLPTVDVEIEAAPGTGFVATEDGQIVVRSEDARISIPGSSGFGIHVRGGNAAAQTSGTTLPVKDIPPVVAAADMQATNLVVAPTQQVSGGTRQVTAAAVQVLKAPFKVTPAEGKIADPFDKVTFTGTVGLPPTAGYGIEWDWNGGHFAFTQNTPTNTIEFVVVKDHRVIATLVTLPGGKVLAADTVKVVIDQPRQWQILTFSDDDNLLNDPDLDGSGLIVGQLTRILQNPASTILSENQRTAGSTELQLRTLMGNGVWDPTQCCPPVPPFMPRDLVLGTNPAEPYQFGPYFSAWNSSTWSESTSDQNTGTMSSQHAFGTYVYNIQGVGSQAGPAGAARLAATRNGANISGTITLYIWFVDEDDGKLSDPPDEYRFSFTGKRLR